MVRDLKDSIEGYGRKTFETPVNQVFGSQLQLAEFSALVPAHSKKHYEDYIARLNAVPIVIDQLL